VNQILYSEELVYNWVKLLLIITSILLLWARAVGGNKIIYLIKFWSLHKYFYFEAKSSIPLFTIFNSLMFFLRIIVFSLSFTLYLFPNEFDESQSQNFLFFSLIITIYILIKYLIENIFSIIFKYRIYFKELSRLRTGLKNLISLHFFIYMLIIIFNPISIKNIIIVGFILYLIYLFLCSHVIYKRYHNKSPKGILYFILYLCAFELGPALTVMWHAFKF
jgi:hypothetical protein